MFIIVQPSICSSKVLIFANDQWAAKKNVWMRNWPLNNLSTNSTTACVHAHIQEREYIHTRAPQENCRRQTVEMDERTKWFNYELSFFLFIYILYALILFQPVRTRVRESDRRRIPLQQHSMHYYNINSFSSFFLRAVRRQRPERFCSSTTLELRVLLSFPFISALVITNTKFYRTRTHNS